MKISLIVLCICLSVSTALAMEKKIHVSATTSTRLHSYVFSEEDMLRILKEELVRMGIVLPEGECSVDIDEPQYYGFGGIREDTVSYDISEKVIIIIEPIRKRVSGE